MNLVVFTLRILYFEIPTTFCFGYYLKANNSILFSLFSTLTAPFLEPPVKIIKSNIFIIMVKSSKVDKHFHNPSTRTSACPNLCASHMAAKMILCGPDGTKPYRQHACCPNGMINHIEGLYNTPVACPCIAAPAWPSCMRPELTHLTILEISRTLLEFYFIII